MESLSRQSEKQARNKITSLSFTFISVVLPHVILMLVSPLVV